jgi:hypothetical protein
MQQEQTINLPQRSEHHINFKQKTRFKKAGFLFEADFI